MQGKNAMDGIHTETNCKQYPYYPDADRATGFEEALKFQDFVVDLLLKELGLAVTNYSSRYYQLKYGENKQGIEIKLDLRMTSTGNVSIEVAEKSRADMPNWTNSGIMRNDNSWLYIQGNYDTVFIFDKKLLLRLYHGRYKSKVWEPKKTIRTFLLPICEAEKYALKMFTINRKEANT